MTARKQGGGMVPIRVDRLRAAQELDGRSWPEIARALETTHQRLYHLSTLEGPNLRRCRQHLRDGFAKELDVPAEWLSGQTDALRYVPSADATVISLLVGDRREVHRRLSMFPGGGGTGRAVPALQLALDRLLAAADEALGRDLRTVDEAKKSSDPEGASRDAYFARLYGLFLVAASIEFGLDLIRPLPPIDDADALRISAVRHAAAVYRPWLDGKGTSPEWERIHKRVLEQVPEDDRATTLGVLHDLASLDLGRNEASNELFAAYEYLRGRHKATA